MATYSIRPIALCGGLRDGSQYTYRMNYGTSCTQVYYAWYIEGSQPKILVDAGVKASTCMAWGMPKLYVPSVEEGLDKLRLKPDDIGIVISTHLHWDHIECGNLYRKAKFVVQKRELDYARNPHPIDAHSYDRSMFEGLDLEVIDGEKEIVPGISVFLTPGHTPGGQSVEIDTTGGKAIITGFCCTLSGFGQTEAMKRWGWEVAPPLLHHDVRDVYDSMIKIKHRADIIIALHDPMFVQKEAIP